MRAEIVFQNVLLTHMNSLLHLVEVLQWLLLKMLALEVHNVGVELNCQHLLVHEETFGSLSLEGAPYPEEKQYKYLGKDSINKTPYIMHSWSLNDPLVIFMSKFDLKREE